jgi:isoamylase
MTIEKIWTGNPFPLGPTITPHGVNFSVFSRHATGMEIVFFDHDDASEPASVIPLDPVQNRTSNYWHACMKGIKPGQLYGYRADGPYEPSRGRRFDRQKLLLDPYGKSVSVGRGYSRAAACYPGDTAASSMKSVVADLSTYDWEGDRPLNRPYHKTVIYEMHVAGFTRHPNSGVSAPNRGKYLGVIERIPYLQELGITAVELLPVFQFDVQQSPSGLSNYWGYAPVSFFAPHLAYSSSHDPLVCLDEFRAMVKALHRAGIEVILDVVYNHTAEGNENGPTLCYRGLENSVYYILQRNRVFYENYTGTGNTLRADHAVVRRLIKDSLQYWVSEMHVDGFRFDLASVFSRSDSGQPMANSPILWDIDSDPALAGAKLIAEAWDAGGLYQVGSFAVDKWKEWNGQFRDDMRRFVKGDRGMVGKLRDRLSGSPDLYRLRDDSPGQGINFVTCHDGFTLNDLVSYNFKHNEKNLESDKDGSAENWSWNCGVEGPSNNPDIERLRRAQIKNLLVLNLLSRGTPMLLMGDEVRRTQQGNNNAYCQDNEVSWFDWDLCKKNPDILRFVQMLIRLRLDCDRSRGGKATLNQILSNAHIAWHGVKLGKPDWSEDSHTLACTFYSVTGWVFHFLVNAYWEPLDFELPPISGSAMTHWRRLIDTSLESPEDIVEVETDAVVTGFQYRVNERSCVMLHYGH